MNATGLLTFAFLRVYFQGPTTHWGIQCVDFDRQVDLHVHVSFIQKYPVPKLVCRSTQRQCYASDGSHAIVSKDIIVDSVHVPLRKWPSVDRIPGNGRWPFCFGGGGAMYGGANITATCGLDADCLDVCFQDELGTTTDTVWCKNATTRKTVIWDDHTQEEKWRPWMYGQPRNDVEDLIELDSPVVLNRATGTSVFARHGSQWIVRRNDAVCLTPARLTEFSCHVMVHGICYDFDSTASVDCVDLTPFPPGSIVALTWQPRLKRTPIQPLDSTTVDLYCLEKSAHDPLRFLACLGRFCPLSRKGLSSLSPFVLVGRSSTIFIRVAPVERTDGGRRLAVAQWASIVVSLGLGFVIWVVVAAAGSRVTSHLHLLEQSMATFLQEFLVDY